ncbi:hypothetical protein C8Q76DRAFT_789621 [Earliella scabrosa]|nr:hypothetical protein C8Q76DRAFT_789616 [Earliella scabrosa]KAI0745200.1 hypothetical protein C8Q76DRAFT_789621 [Earliella scabrosa]
MKGKRAASSSRKSSADEDEDVEMANATGAGAKSRRKPEDDDRVPGKLVKIPNGDAAPSSNSGTTITVFYRRASWNVMNEWLAQQLAECGELVSVRVHMDLNTGSSRECGYVTFAATQAVKAAHKHNDTVRENRAKLFDDTQNAATLALFESQPSFNLTQDTV